MTLEINGAPKLPKENLVVYAYTGHHARGGHLQPDDFRYMVQLYRDSCRPWGFDPDRMYLQALHETEFFTSERFTRSNNFAGIGATDDGAWGAVNPNWIIGIQQQVAHMVAYTQKPGALSPHDYAWCCVMDPRFKLVTDHSARTYQYLSGRWASDLQYGDKIESHYLVAQKMGGLKV